MAAVITIIVILFALLGLAFAYNQSQLAIIQAEADLEKWRGFREYGEATNTAANANLLAIIFLLVMIAFVLAVVALLLYRSLQQSTRQHQLPTRRPQVTPLPAQPQQPAALPAPTNDPIQTLIQLRVLDELERRNQRSLPTSTEADWRQQ